MEEQKEKWQGRFALSSAIIAVLTAFTTLYMGKYSSRAIMSQGQESDQWALYQAKGIKQHTFEINRKTLELQYHSLKGLPPQVADEYIKTLAKFDEESKRYENERKVVRSKAEGFAAIKLKAQEMSGDFSCALIFLQIAIMLSSLASLTRRNYLWFIALGCNAGWLYFFLDGWMLFH